MKADLNEWAEYVVDNMGVDLATYRARIGSFFSGRNVNCDDQRRRKACVKQWWRRQNVELVSNALSATSNDKFMTITLSSWSRSLDIHVYVSGSVVFSLLQPKFPHVGSSR